MASVALVLSTLSFAAGIAGDLAEPPRSGERVVVRIPPELPADTPRAAPLPPLTTPAAAAEIQRPPRQLREETTVVAAAPEPIVAIAKPPSDWVLSVAKPDADRGPKPENA